MAARRRFALPPREKTPKLLINFGDFDGRDEGLENRAFLRFDMFSPALAFSATLRAVSGLLARDDHAARELEEREPHFVF
jgi:hypothetical protein